MATDILGFPVNEGTGSSGEFVPIVKYDAKAGRIFRIERVDTGNGFENQSIDITPMFKAVFDFETVLTGWMLFMPSTAPSFALVLLDPDNQTPLPPRPSPEHKHGTKTLIKLSVACAGGEERRVREIAGNSTAWKDGYRKLYSEYRAERHRYPGQLPVVVLVKTEPVTSSNGRQRSTNYHPVWRIDGWVKRPVDLPREIRPMSVANPGPALTQDDDFGGTAPSTGNQTVPPPNRYPPVATGHAPAKQTATILDDDFG